MSASRPSIVFLLLALLALAIYWPGLNGPLILDDVPNLLSLKQLSAQGMLTFSNVMAERLPGIDGRPLSMLSFIVNWRLSGESVWWLKASNVLLHLLASALAFALAARLLAIHPDVNDHRARWLALWVAAAWMLTPVQVSTVLYVVQRMAILSALFTLAGLLAWTLARERAARSPRTSWVLFACVFLVFLPAAALSKQTGALLPFLILVIEHWFLRLARIAPMSALVRAALAVACAAPVVVVVARFVRDPHWLDAAYSLRDFELMDRLVSAPRLLFDYAASALQIPGASPLGLFRDDVVLSSSLMSPPTTLLAAIALLVLIAIGLRVAGRRLSMLLGGIMLFVVAHSLEASFPAIEPYFEHRNYLPSFGLLVAIAAGVSPLLSHARGPKLLAATLLVLLAIHAGLTALRVDTWRSWPDIVAANVAAHPGSVRAQAGRAVLAIEARNLDEAERALARVLELGGPSRRFGVAAKRIVARCKAAAPISRAYYRALLDAMPIQDDPYTVAALAWLRETISDGRCASVIDSTRLAEAVDVVVTRSASELRFNHSWTLHRDAAALLAHADRVQRARLHLREAMKLAPASRRRALSEQLGRL